MAAPPKDRVQQIIAADEAGRIDFDGSFPTDFTSKRVLVTGGASGIGAATARMFASQGAHVIIADMDAQTGTALAAELEQHFVQVDIASWESQVAMFTEALRLLPAQEIDILVTSAGTPGSTTWDMAPCSSDELLRSEGPVQAPSTTCLDVGLAGCMNTAYLGVKYAMGLDSEDHGDKCVILLGSLAGFSGIPARPDYTATKWGMRGVFRCLRQTLPQVGARANLVAPYFIETPMTSPIMDILKQRGVQLGKMEMVLKAIARMAADTDMNGRAVTITCEGAHDLEDDTSGLDAGKAMLDLKERGVTVPQPSATTPRYSRN